MKTLAITVRTDNNWSMDDWLDHLKMEHPCAHFSYEAVQETKEETKEA